MRTANIRPATSQRKLLLSVIREAKGLLDAKELYRRASERDASISLATVYRNLRFFKEQELINERHFGHTRSCCYEMKRSGEHYHLVCRGCGHVIEFGSPLIHRLVAEIRRKNDFAVTRVELCLEGYCHDCKKEEKPSSKVA
ncbi:MAG: transcriptional repressor [Dehalococcoidia bacterium]|nr:transcriptional repressor [Dehalococcoidia bacterium]